MSRYSIHYDAVGKTPFKWIVIDPDGEPVDSYLTVEAAAEDLVDFERREAEVAAEDEDEDGDPLGEVTMAFDVTCYAVIDLDAREVTSVHVMDEETRDPRLVDPDDRYIVDLAHEIFNEAEWPGWTFGW